MPRLGVNVQVLALETPGQTTVDPSSSVAERFGPLTTTAATSVVLHESRGAVASVSAYPGIATDDREIRNVPRGFNGGTVVVAAGTVVAGVSGTPVDAGGEVGATIGWDAVVVAPRGAVDVAPETSRVVAVTIAAVGATFGSVTWGGACVTTAPSEAGSTV